MIYCNTIRREKEGVNIHLFYNRKRSFLFSVNMINNTICLDFKSREIFINLCRKHISFENTISTVIQYDPILNQYFKALMLGARLSHVMRRYKEDFY